MRYPIRAITQGLSQGSPSIYDYRGRLYPGQTFFETLVGYDTYTGEPIYEVTNRQGLTSNLGVVANPVIGNVSLQNFYVDSSPSVFNLFVSPFLPTSGNIYPLIDSHPLVSSSAGANPIAYYYIFDYSFGVGAPGVIQLSRVTNSDEYVNSVNVNFAVKIDAVISGTSVTIPSNVSQLTVVAIGGGGGGSRRSTGTGFGGGSGAFVKKTVKVSSSAWGSTVTYAIGSAGLGRTGSAGSGTAGGATTVTSTSLSINISAGGGQPGTTSGPGAGGTASGGDTNQTGVDGIGVNGGVLNQLPEPANLYLQVDSVAFPGLGGQGAPNPSSNGVKGIQGGIYFIWEK